MRQRACPGGAAGAGEHRGGVAAWPAGTELPPAHSTSAQASPAAVLSEPPWRRTSPVTAFHPYTQKTHILHLFPHMLIATLVKIAIIVKV